MKKLHVLKIVLFYLMIFVFSCQKDHEVESITIIKNPNLSVVNTIYNHNHLSSSPCQIYGDNIITSTTGSNGESFISMISLTNSINSHINLNKKYLEFNKTYIFDKYAVFQNPNTYYVVDLDEKKFLFTKTLDSPNGQNEIRYSFGHLYYSCEENGNKVKIKKVEIQSGKEDIISEHILSSTSSQVGNVNIINDSINGKLNLCYTLFNEPSIGENTVYVKNVNNSESSTYQYSETSIDGFFTFSITSGSILLDQIGNTLICSETKTGKILWKTEFDYRSNIDRSWSLIVTDKFIFVYGNKMTKIDLLSGLILENSDLYTYPGDVSFQRQYPDRHIVSYGEHHFVHFLAQKKIIYLGKSDTSPCYTISQDYYLWNHFGSNFFEAFKLD